MNAARPGSDAGARFPKRSPHGRAGGHSEYDGKTIARSRAPGVRLRCGSRLALARRRRRARLSSAARLDRAGRTHRPTSDQRSSVAECSVVDDRDERVIEKSASMPSASRPVPSDRCEIPNGCAEAGLSLNLPWAWPRSAQRCDRQRVRVPAQVLRTSRPWHRIRRWV